MALLTLDVPENVTQTVAALPAERRAAYLAGLNAFAVAILPQAEPVPCDDDPADEPLDEAFIAELIAADEEYIRSLRSGHERCGPRGKYHRSARGAEAADTGRRPRY